MSNFSAISKHSWLPQCCHLQLALTARSFKLAWCWWVPIWSQLIWPFSHFAVLVVFEDGFGMDKTCASFVLQICIISAVLKFGQNVKVPMKVVDEPVNFEYVFQAKLFIF